MEPVIKMTAARWIVLAVVVFLIAFYYFSDPYTSRFMPQCVFHRVTGLQCVGCGSQRMIHMLLHGDVAGAFRANAFAFMSMPFMVFLVWVDLHRVSHPVLYRRIYTMTLAVIAGVLLIVWFIIRNILHI